jgi:hypothetical protein
MVADSGYLRPLSTWRIGRWLRRDKISAEVRSFRSCLKSLEECRRWWSNLRGNSYLYVFMISRNFRIGRPVYPSTPTSNSREKKPITLGYTCSLWLQHDDLTPWIKLVNACFRMCWRVDISRWLLDSSCGNIGEARHWCGIDSVWTVHIVVGRVYGVSIVQFSKKGRLRAVAFRFLRSLLG